MIRKALNRRLIVRSLSRPGAHRPLGLNGAGILYRSSRLRYGILPLLAVAMGQFMLFLAAARN
ncbi:MAG: hypothetical protein KAT39_15530 [Alphaproteobacteria bacterium]|nr:hypothetical protein [Alphaproteobacteria bacterium]